MIDRINYSSDRINPSIAFTVCIAGIFFSGQAQSTDFAVINAPLAPNPNQAGDLIQILGQATNTEDYNNTGSIRLNDGASLVHGANYFLNIPSKPSPVFTNSQGGSVDASGMQVTPFAGGGGMYSFTNIVNRATFINTDNATTFNNLHGASLVNGESLIINSFPSPVNATFINRQGATVNNSGAFEVALNDYSLYEASKIGNYGFFSNSDTGSSINNQKGAIFSNGGGNQGLLGSTPSTTSMVNQNGAAITNSGAYSWQTPEGYSGYMTSKFNNNAIFTNTGENTRLNNLDGASLNNGSMDWAGIPASTDAILTNEQAAILTNSGAFTHIDSSGYTSQVKSTINNIQATLINTGNGSQLINQQGAEINNNSSGYGFNPVSNISQFTNQAGAVLTNTGAYNWTDENGVTRIDQSGIKNDGATITNTGIGSKLNNQQGAVLINGQGFGGFNTLPTVLTNQNGATLTNSGGHHWQDETGQNQITASLINNQGKLINTGTGTALHNLDGANLVNSLFGIVKNQDAALLANGNGASVINDGKIINDALITNAGSFQVGQGSMEGNGQYLQTAGETVLSGGFFAQPQWSQSLTTIQGGTLTGSGTMNSAVVIDGGTVALGSPNNFNTGLPFNHPGLTINGDLSFNSGLIKIHVGSDASSPFGLFGNPFFPAPVTTTDSLKVSSSTTFNGGVVEIDFVNGFTPTLGESLAWLTFAGDINGLETLQYRFTGLANDRALAFNRDGNNLIWTVTAAAVPLPTSSWLFVTGVLSLMARRRKR